MTETPEQLPLPMEVPGLDLEETTLKAKYLEAIKDLYCPWAERHPRNRFAEYDKYRAIWCAELYNWLQGDNTLRVYSLTEFAWKVQHERLSEGGLYCMCLNWSDRRQRVYLGDGLLEYLGLLKDEVERVYPDRPTKSHYRDEIFAPEPEEPDPYQSPEYAAFVEKWRKWPNSASARTAPAMAASLAASATAPTFTPMNPNMMKPMNKYTPLHLSILIHVNSSCESIPTSDAHDQYVTDLIADDLIAPDIATERPSSGWMLTERGKAHIQQMCTLPLPTHCWARSDGSVIPSAFFPQA